MKRRPNLFSLLLVLSVSSGPPVFAAGTTRVDEVTVFSDRAAVTRASRVDCRQGKAQAVFERLPDTLDPRSLHGAVRGKGDVVGLVSEIVEQTEAVDERARAIEEELRRVRGEIAAEESRKSGFATTRSSLDVYGAILVTAMTEDMRNPKPDPVRFGRDVTALRRKREALDEGRRQSDAKLRTLRLTEQKLARDLERQGGGQTRRFRVATVTVDCKGTTEADVTVGYVLPGATWQPEYDVDFAARDKRKVGPGRARLTVGAVVRQSTGEDWTDARILLSTAKPRLGSEAPRPAPIWVEATPRSKDRTLVAGQERRDDLRAGGGGGNGGPADAVVDDKGNTFVLTLPHRVTIPADGRPTWSPVDVVETNANAKLVAIPKLDDHVYQVVAFDNPAAYPLPDGRVRSYRGGSFIGDTRLAYKGVGEPMEISLGVDDEVRIERKVLDHKDREAGFLSSTKHILRSFRNTLTSSARGDVSVELRENIPVSKLDDVTVEIAGKETTRGFAHDKVRGFLTWPVNLRPGQKATVDLAYTIHLPDDWDVNVR